MNTSPSERIKELQLQFPPAPKPAGVYRPVLVVGNFLYVSGQAPVNFDGTLMQGRAGDDLSLEEAKMAARQVGLTMLSTIRTHFGDMDRVKRLVKVFGMVNCTPDFKSHPLVMNGFSFNMEVGGFYRIDGMKFQMPGWWVVTINVMADGVHDAVSFNLDVL